MGIYRICHKEKSMVGRDFYTVINPEVPTPSSIMYLYSQIHPGNTMLVLRTQTYSLKSIQKPNFGEANHILEASWELGIWRCICEHVMGFSRPIVYRRSIKDICVQQQTKRKTLYPPFTSKINEPLATRILFLGWSEMCSQPPKCL